MKKTCQNVKLCSIATSDLINITYIIIDPDVNFSSKNFSFFTLSSLYQIWLNT
jgi:hypothetical protein